MDELNFWLKLMRAPVVQAAQLQSLLQQFGSAAALETAPPAALRAAGLSQASIDRLRAVDEKALARDREWLARDSHCFVPFGSALYPPLLAELSDAPLGLYVRGDPACLARPQLAIVGTRNPTHGGRDIAESFARHLVSCGVAITSGLAAGIDAAGHRGALAGGGQTVAVCGTGLDIVYPRSSEDLSREVAASGALVSEFPPGTPPRKNHFPQRNRIISGLSLGVLVVEAALHSGSLITARLAGEQGREVFAIPGSIHNPMAKGCHQLIRQGAKLVDSVTDILSELGPMSAALRPFAVAEATDRNQVFSPQLDKDYKILLDAFDFEPVGIDLLVSRTGLRADEVASMLLILELEGLIESFPGGLYERVQPEAAK